MLRQVTFLAVIASAFAGVPPRMPRLDGRIVGGEATTIDEYQHQISLQWLGGHSCGGSQIDATHILTAAHCTDGTSPSSLTVRAGSSFRGSGGQVVNVVKIIQHEKYNSFTIDYDICILVVSEPLTVGGLVTLVSSNGEPGSGTSVSVTGWGALWEGGSAPSQLQVVHVPMVSRDDCKDAYGSSAITDRMICAGHPEGGKDSCQGDSGGPVVITDSNGEHTQVGVVSWGRGCARPNYPGVYSNVANMRDWITANTGI